MCSHSTRSSIFPHRHYTFYFQRFGLGPKWWTYQNYWFPFEFLLASSCFPCRASSGDEYCAALTQNFIHSLHDKPNVSTVSALLRRAAKASTCPGSSMVSDRQVHLLGNSMRSPCRPQAYFFFSTAPYIRSFFFLVSNPSFFELIVVCLFGRQTQTNPLH